jgi:hypothetical protein
MGAKSGRPESREGGAGKALQGLKGKLKGSLKSHKRRRRRRNEE